MGGGTLLNGYSRDWVGAAEGFIDFFSKENAEGVLGLEILNLELRKMPPHLLECQLGPKEE